MNDDYKSPSTFLKLKSNIEFCGNCNSIITERNDEHRGEYFCEHCGYVLNKFYIPEYTIEDIHVENQRLKEELKYGRFKKVEHEKIIKLQEKYDKKTNGDRQLYRKEEYKNYVLVLNTHFMMTDTQKKKIYKLIDLIDDFRALCRGCDYRAIIGSLAVKIQKEDGRFISFDKPQEIRLFFEEIGLTEKLYFKIIENLFDYTKDKNDVLNY